MTGTTLTAPSPEETRLQVHHVPRAHLVGIAGAGMRSLARVLDEAGWSISGSDPQAALVANLGYEVHDWHAAQHVDEDTDLVVYSDAVPDTNPELARARELGRPTYSYPQMLGEWMQSRRGAAVAGTHGKSTTTAMAGAMLVAAGLDPTVVYGAAPVGANCGGRHGRGRWMLAEACEYRDNFRHLQPELAVLLGIEPDHFDCYSTSEDLEAAFARFVRRVPADGLVLARAECAATLRAISELQCPSETFGLAAGAMWQATELRDRQGYYSFEIRYQRRLVTDIKLQVPGKHNVLNALAAAALATHCGVTASAIRQGLERFVGLRRRLQLLGEVRSIAILDDYAHHPTEVSAGLATIRQMYAGRRVWCVFQPHQVSRTLRLAGELAASLQNADKVVLADVFPAREDHDEDHGAEALAATRQLAARTASLGADVIQLATRAEIHDHLRGHVAAGDVVVTMGAGNIGTVAHDLGQGLRTFRQAG